MAVRGLISGSMRYGFHSFFASISGFARFLYIGFFGSCLFFSFFFHLLLRFMFFLVEKNQEDMKRITLASAYGAAFPVQMGIERQMLSRFQRPPGPIPSSMLGLEALTGSLEDFGFEDYMNVKLSATLSLKKKCTHLTLPETYFSLYKFYFQVSNSCPLRMLRGKECSGFCFMGMQSM
ncbi:proteasome maturation factor UMP1 family protein [Salix suchowensis]|nr:proteasome maturation factor UMP1 family protein [Salix suchowensis]